MRQITCDEPSYGPKVLKGHTQPTPQLCTELYGNNTSLLPHSSTTSVALSCLHCNQTLPAFLAPPHEVSFLPFNSSCEKIQDNPLSFCFIN